MRTDDRVESAYIECMAAQDAAHWEARRRRLTLNDHDIGALLRAAAPHILAAASDIIERPDRPDQHCAYTSANCPWGDACADCT